MDKIDKMADELEAAIRATTSFPKSNMVVDQMRRLVNDMQFDRVLAVKNESERTLNPFEAMWRLLPLRFRQWVKYGL